MTVEAVTRHLEEEGVEFEVIEHEPTMTAMAEAHAAHVPPDGVAKTLVVHADGGYVLAVIPASERLDLKKVRAALSDEPKVNLASEAEMEADFPNYELGAVPPFGELMQNRELVDQRLLEHDKIVCTAGARNRSLLVGIGDVVRLADAQVVDLCQD